MVADTSVLVNLKRGQLLEQCFALPLKFKMPDLLYEKALAAQGGEVGFAGRLIHLGLEVVEMSGEEVGSAIVQWREHPSLTLPDSFALAVAASRRWTLLTDDSILRELAQGLKVSCRGVLWVIDRIHEEGIASPTELASSLTAIRDHPRCRLPRAEIDTRIRLYGVSEA